MSQTKDDFLEILAERQLLPPDVASTLRSLAADAGDKAQPRHLAKWLVDNGHLTKFQAQQLLTEKPARLMKSAPPDDDDLEVVVDRDAEEDLLSEAPKPATKQGSRAAWSGGPAVARAAPSSSPSPAPSAPPAYAPPASLPPQGMPGMPGMVPGSMVPGSIAPGSMIPGSIAPGGMPGTIPPGPSPYGAPPSGMFGAPPMGMADLMAPGGMPGAPGIPNMPGAPPPGGKKRGAVGGKKNQGKKDFGSKLILMVGGVFLTLAALAVALPLLIFRENGDESFKLAEADYQAGAYSQAVERFQKYITDFPKHKDVETAKVHLGLARMRGPVDSRNWSLALSTATEVLDEISQSKEFAAASADVKVMLPKILEGLSAKAANPPDAKLLDEADEARKLLDRYVPPASRPEDLQQNLKNVEDSLNLTRERLQRDKRLTEAVTEIRKALEENNTGQAYLQRNAAVKIYPELALDAGLAELMSTAAQRERAKVTKPADSVPALQGPPADIEDSVVMAARTPGTLSGVSGMNVYALSEGAAYGLDAAEGKVRWRYYVGLDTTAIPVGVGPNGRDGAVVFDSQRLELACVAGDGSGILWRLPIGEPMIGQPLVMGDKLIIATRGGSLISVESLTGAVRGRLKFPQELSGGPATDSRQRVVYVPGRQSNLFVASPDAGDCRAVLYVGHEPETIKAPAVLFSRYLVVVENLGLNTSKMRVFEIDSDGMNPKPLQQLDLEGHVLTPMVMSQKLLLVSTNRGAVYAFEASSPEQPPQLTKLAEKAPLAGKPLVRYLAVNGVQAFVSENQLSRFDIQTAKGQLNPKWIKFRDEVSKQPPQFAGAGGVIHVHGLPGRPGVVVSALNADNGDEVWKTELGVPHPADPKVAAGGGKLTSVSALGSLFDVRLSDEAKPLGAMVEAVGKSVIVRVALPETTFREESPSGTSLLSSAALGNQVLIFDDKQGERLRAVYLPDQLGAAPAVVGEWLAAPGKTGALALTDLKTGAAVGDPFQPKVEAGGGSPWNVIASIGPTEILAGDSGGRLYRLEVSEGAKPSWKQLGEATLDRPATGRIAALKAGAIIIDGADRAIFVDYNSLRPGPTATLGAKVNFGPVAVGEGAVLSTAEGKAWYFSATGESTWQVPVPGGRLVGASLNSKNEVVLTAASGLIRSFNPGTGQPVAEFDAHQPLGGSPFVVGSRLAVPGHDGTLHLFTKDELK